MFRPLVSIIIPVYNGSNYVREAIDSAIAQTYKNREIIVVNDGSNDNGETERIILSYGDSVRYVKKENGGVSSALNTGIGLANGEYISWLSHDDVYYPTKLEKQVEQLANSTEKCAIVMCANRQIDKNSEFVGRSRFCKLPTDEIIGWEYALMHIIKTSCNGCTLLIPKAVFDKCGLFDEGLRYAQDYFMWLNIFSDGYPLIYGKDVNVGARVHKQQLTQTGRDLFVSDSCILAERILPKLAILSSQKNNYVYQFAKTYAKHHIRPIVDCCIETAKSKKLFSLSDRIVINAIYAYGAIRPLIKKMYYRLVKRVEAR